MMRVRVRTACLRSGARSATHTAGKEGCPVTEPVARIVRRRRLGIESGITLVELMVTLVILGIIGGTAYVLLGNIIAKSQAKGVSEQLAGAIRQTRQLAITQANDHCITIGTTDYTIRDGTCPGTTVIETRSALESSTINTSISITTNVGNNEFTFTPVSSVVPAGGQVTTQITESGKPPCIVVLNVTASGGVMLAPPPVSTCPD